MRELMNSITCADGFNVFEKIKLNQYRAFLSARAKTLSEVQSLMATGLRLRLRHP